MNKLNNLGDNEFILGTLILVANKLQTQLDRSLAEFNMTAKQWFLATTV